MRDLLHDRVDKREDLQERAQLIVEDVIEKEIGDIAQYIDNFEDLMVLLAAKVAERLDDVTTDAVHSGSFFAEKLAKVRHKIGT